MRTGTFCRIRQERPGGNPMGMRPEALSRGFQREFGVSPKQFQLEARARAIHQAPGGRADASPFKLNTDRSVSVHFLNNLHGKPCA
jgi:hypothetical protein